MLQRVLCTACSALLLTAVSCGCSHNIAAMLFMMGVMHCPSSPVLLINDNPSPHALTLTPQL